MQVHADAVALGKHLPFTLGLAFGGTDYDKQRAELAAGVDVLIGTPGRIIDFYKQRVFGLRGIQVLILDEADRMFDLGFIKDIRYVLRRLPEHHRRLNMLFSATLSHRVLELAYEHMNDPGARAHRAGQDDGRSRHAVASTSPRWRRSCRCCSRCCATATRTAR